MLAIRGTAADHLYRESASSSFWETVFGSALRRKRRPKVSYDASGAKLFEVDASALLPALRSSLQNSAQAAAFPADTADFPYAGFAVSLIGRQTAGSARAEFTLSIRLDGVEAETERGKKLQRFLQEWWTEKHALIARDHLSPFGFEPSP